MPGGPDVLKIVERDIPNPGRSEILLRVVASGVNRPDIFQRMGNYPAPPGTPADIPGLEVAGTVTDCGSDVRRWKRGDKICALLGGGGYAEYVSVDERHCLPVPQNVSLFEAAALPETVFTVWHNVFQIGRLVPGESLLLHGGSSGIGTTGIQLATILGSTVFATAGSDEKCGICESLGAAKCINYKKEDFEDILAVEGVDVILDMVGGNYISKNLKILRDGGRLIFINAMDGSKGEFNALDIMRRRLTIAGSTLRSRDADFKASLAAEVERHVWPLWEAGEFQVKIDKVFDLKDAAKAHELMESSQHAGKIVLSV